MKKQVLVIGSSRFYYAPFVKFGNYTDDQDLFETPERIALVVFTGGADVSPSLYGERRCRETSCQPNRDVMELAAFRQAAKLKLPMAGICRGAQFLCVAAGGKLMQHITGHGYDHKMRLWDGRLMHVSSTHHQMMLPAADAKLLGWTEPRLSKVYLGDNDVRLEPPATENEVCYFPTIKAIGMQYHPEMMESWSEGFRLCEELTDRLMHGDSF